MGDLRNPAELKEIWQTWHENVGRPMRQDYTRMVEIANQGAKELGYADTGAMWRSNYDMSPEEFSAMYDRLWAETKPLYDQLHCYTRTKLNQKYGNAVQPATGPIRADLLGNMWAQEWGNIYDVVAPKGRRRHRLRPHRSAGEEEGYDPTEMVRIGERFYTSLGLAPLPADVLDALADRAPAKAAKWSATLRPGTSTTRTTCASRCAPRSMPTTSSPSTTSLATIIISAPTTSSRTSISTAPTTASTRRSATSSRCR